MKNSKYQVFLIINLFFISCSANKSPVSLYDEQSDCTITNDKTNYAIKVLKCKDGTSAQIKEDGTCSGTNVPDKGIAIDCGTSKSLIPYPKNGEGCSLSPSTDNTTILKCGDSEIKLIAGQNGEDGKHCTITNNHNWTSTHSCPNSPPQTYALLPQPWINYLGYSTNQSLDAIELSNIYVYSDSLMLTIKTNPNILNPNNSLLNHKFGHVENLTNGFQTLLLSSDGQVITRSFIENIPSTADKIKTKLANNNLSNNDKIIKMISISQNYNFIITNSDAIKGKSSLLSIVRDDYFDNMLISSTDANVVVTDAVKSPEGDLYITGITDSNPKNLLFNNQTVVSSQIPEITLENNTYLSFVAKINLSSVNNKLVIKDINFLGFLHMKLENKNENIKLLDYPQPLMQYIPQKGLRILAQASQISSYLNANNISSSEINYKQKGVCNLLSFNTNDQFISVKPIITGGAICTHLVNFKQNFLAVGGYFYNIDDSMPYLNNFKVKNNISPYTDINIGNKTLFISLLDMQ